MRRYGLNEDVAIRCSIWSYAKNFFILTQKIQLSTISLNEAYNFFLKRKLIQKLIVQINSKSEYKRKRAITYLSLFRNKVTKKALAERLLIEQKENIKILIVNGLKRDIDNSILKNIVTSLINSRRYYQLRVVKLLSKYIDQSEYDLSTYFDSPLIEIKESFIELAMQVYHPTFEKPLLETLKMIENHYIYEDSFMLKNIRKDRTDRLYHQTLTALSTHHNFNLSANKYLASNDFEVCKIAANSLTINNDLKTVMKLASYASQTQKDVIYSNAIHKMCENNKALYIEIYKLFKESKDNRIKYMYAGVLSRKIDYLLLILESDIELNNLLESMINSKYSANLINWLNSNKNKKLEDKVLDIIRPIAEENYEFYLELNNYLEPDIFKKMGYIHTKYPGQVKPTTEPEFRKFRWLLTILLISLLLMPVIYISTNLGFIFSNPFIDSITRYLIKLNIWFIYYYIFVNGLYIFFAIIAIFEYKRQERLWDIKSRDFTYETGIISPISIIVPAYNEELNIVENIRSLLSLEYPLFEVIVVNDGSKDRSLENIIDAFDLRRVDYRADQKIQTRTVKAIYKNKFYSKLTLIDKDNGGKADALNVGINFSQHDYVCGIDADSLIESDGLLRMMATILDHDEITLALGGSIVPSNGSIVDHGMVEKFGLPKSSIARFQAIEYLRAFNTGRLAFAKLKCFLIVSGAFGLFEKRILTEIGGYLSASSFKKNTVGEDMELVVRITKKAAESSLNYRVDYIPMARCYTEVPESMKILKSQRNRWQRGLIETLSFHRDMIMNPQYGPNGLFALPYFFIFEMIAPLLELQIYLTLIIGMIFGIFNSIYILLLLVATCFFGMSLSLVSLLVQEKYSTSLSFKDTMILIFYGIIENFGWRQVISIYRTWGYFSSLKGKHTWGSMTRVGFKK
jgi:cellulose synthase/poly-beta-1,6-N-acetylglucosamine synthase-like glycosyltransferase